MFNTRGYADKTLQRDAELMVQQVVPQIQPVFWSVIYRLVLRGRYGDASKIIRYAGTFVEQIDNNNYELIERLLSKAPDLATCTDPIQFLGRWKQWQVECQVTLERLSKPASIEPQLIQLLRLINGDPETIIKLASGWPEALIALLLHRQPQAKPYQIK